MKILLADDNPEVRSALRLLLEQEPMQAIVMEVSDTQSLLAHLSENCPMIVLLDWELPELHNSDVLMMIRSRCPGIKVIALSSKFEARQEALAARVDAFISKTEPPEQILSTLRSFIPHQTNE
jgi:DNA-binding NarL/FixJ family response regulator